MIDMIAIVTVISNLQRYGLIVCIAIVAIYLLEVIIINKKSNDSDL